MKAPQAAPSRARARDAVLGGVVRALVRRRDERVHGAGVDDAAPAARQHARQRRLGRVEGRGQAHGDNGVPPAAPAARRSRSAPPAPGTAGTGCRLRGALLPQLSREACRVAIAHRVWTAVARAGALTGTSDAALLHAGARAARPCQTSQADRAAGAAAPEPASATSPAQGAPGRRPHLSSGNSCTGATCWMPTLFTNMSSLPRSRCTPRIMSLARPAAFATAALAAQGQAEGKQWTSAGSRAGGPFAALVAHHQPSTSCTAPMAGRARNFLATSARRALAGPGGRAWPRRTVSQRAASRWRRCART